MAIARNEDPMVTLQQSMQAMNRQMATQFAQVTTDMGTIKNAVVSQQGVMKQQSTRIEAIGQLMKELGLRTKAIENNIANVTGARVQALEKYIENMKSTAESVTLQIKEVVVKHDVTIAKQQEIEKDADLRHHKLTSELAERTAEVMNKHK